MGLRKLRMGPIHPPFKGRLLPLLRTRAFDVLPPFCVVPLRFSDIDEAAYFL